MDARIKAEWIKALRSGEYKQAKGDLRVRLDPEGKEYGFCCLGVLCDMYAKEKGIEKPWSGEGVGGCGDGVYTKFNGKQRNGTLVQEVKDWAGLEYGNGKYTADNSLAIDNDNGKTFAEIADIIDKNF